MKKPYFRPVPDAPAPLTRTCEREIRFEEVDPLGIVWHGRYPSYIDDGRLHLGKKYGLGYMDFKRHRVAAPIKQLHIDYHKPLYFGETVKVVTWLHYNEAARLNFEFELRNSVDEVTTTGYSVQMFIDETQELLIAPPDFYADILLRWKNGELA